MSKTDQNRNDDLMEGRYRILGTLGEGGVGVVYKAQDTLLDKTVAIKKIQSQSNATDVIRFQKEAKVAGALIHPNILGVIDFGLSKDNSFYLVLNFIEGESLSNLLKRTGPVPLFEALDIFIQIARGLAHAHKHKVIHRDIKPSNVMLVGDIASSVEALIVDFGLAKTLEQDQSLTKSGVGIGTPRYMSPEQIRADREIGPATDIYAMGCLMFETLVGKPAFQGENVMQTLQMHLFDDIPDLNSVGDLKFPDGMVEIVNKCLQKDANSRYASGMELLTQLTEFLEYLQTTSGEPVDASKLSAKLGATAGDGSGDSSKSTSTNDMPLGSKLAAFLRLRYPLIGAILLSSIVLLLFAVPILSNLMEPESYGPIRMRPVDAIFKFGAREPEMIDKVDNHLKKEGARALSASFENLDSPVIATDVDFEGERSPVEPPMLPDVDGSDGSLLKESSSRLSDNVVKRVRVSEISTAVIADSVQDLENNFDALKPLSTFHWDSDKRDRLEAFSPDLPSFKALKSFGKNSPVKCVKITECAKLPPEAIPYLIPLSPRELIIEHSPLLGATLAELQKLPSLRRLVLSEVDVPPDAAKALANLKNLESVALHDMKVSDATLDAVGKLSNLRELMLLRSTGISDDGFSSLTKLSELKRLHLNKLHLTDKQLSMLQSFRKLDVLRLDGSYVSAAGLECLEAMKWLRKLSVAASPTLKPPEIERLARALPKTEVIYKDLQRKTSGIDTEEVKRATPDSRTFRIDDKSINHDEEPPISLDGFHDGTFRYATSGKFWAVFPKDKNVKELVAKQGSKVHRIQLRRASVSGAGYALLKPCPLTFVEFENSRITPEVLVAIGNLPDVMTVALKRCPEIDFSHLTELNRLKEFHELIIEGSLLTKSDMTNIAKVQRVDQLKLDNSTGLTRDNLTLLLKLPRLGALHMVSTDFDDSGFDVLKKIRLSNLVLTGTRITKDGLASYLKAVGKKPMYVDVSLNKSITAAELVKLRAIHPTITLNQVKPKIDTDFVFHAD